MVMQKVTVRFVDITGQRATETYTSPEEVEPDSQAGLVTVLDAISDAGITGMAFTTFDSAVSGDPGTGAYDSPQDKALLFFKSIGGTYQVAIPAPYEGLFGSDKETVSPTAAATLIDWIETNGKDPNGNALTYVSGRREKTSSKQK